jgi:hypothetical protein
MSKDVKQVTVFVIKIESNEEIDYRKKFADDNFVIQSDSDDRKLPNWIIARGN